MIQLTANAPQPLPRNGDDAGTAVIGVGRAGVHIIDQLILQRCGPRHLLAVDTDEQDIRASVAPYKHLLGRHRLRGLGTGGDTSLAADLARADSVELDSLCSGVTTAILVAGLGGGTGTGAAPVIASGLRAIGARVFAVVCLPFEFEGARVIRATKGLEALQAACDGVAAFSSGRLLHMPEAREDIRQIFRQANVLAARSAVALLHLLDGSATAPLDAAGLRALLGTAGLENAWAAHGSAQGADRMERVAGQILASPYLEDGEVWKRANAAVLSVVGGSDMPVAETRELASRLQQAFPVDLDIRSSARVDPRFEGVLSATLILASPQNAPTQAPRHSSSQPVAQPTPLRPPQIPQDSSGEKQAFSLSQSPPARRVGKKMPTPQRYFARQEELPLDQKINRGRFEKTTPTVIDGQDLDIPTFLRHGIKLKV